ncbi:MAG: phenylalanine--tRNA ligase subunit beta, partial [Candidatus Pacearchaeota archaeon]
KKQFEEDIGTLNEDIQSKISMFGTPIESITENEIQLEIFPNRPDLLSYQGFKRAFLSFLGKKTGFRDYKVNKPEKDYEVIIDSSVKDIRPFTACSIIKDLDLNNERIREIIEMQEKLHLTIGRKRKKLAIGIYPLEKIKLPITFLAIEPDKIKFIPLEMDKELSGLEILQKHPAGKEYSHLLAGKAKFPIFVDSTNQILSMPPIINSQTTGKITTKTKDVFIECSGFDFEILKKCLNIIVTSLADMGGKIYQMNLKYKRKELTPDLTPEKMKISLENTNKLLGLELKEKDLKNLIEKMGFSYCDGVVSIPAWRVDILHEVDIIEDIAIAYGYDKFIPQLPSIPTTGEENKKEVIKRKIAEILIGLGFIEVLNYHLTNRRNQREKMNLSEKEPLIEVEASKSEYNVLRENLSHLLLKNFSENVDSEYPQEIFELGKIFFQDGDKIKEKESLAIGIAPGNFTRIKQILEYLFKMIDRNINIKESEKTPPYLIDGRTVDIIFKNKKIGVMGETHPKILQNWKIKMPISLLEIEIDDILESFE